MPICWVGGHALTSGSSLGFNTVASMHKPPNAATTIAHHDPVGHNMGTSDALQGNLDALRIFLCACCAWHWGEHANGAARPVQAGGWECGHYAALLVQQLLVAPSHGMPFRMMAFSFGLQQLGCLMLSLLHAVLLQSTTALKAMCTAERGVGIPCAFLVAELKEVAGQGWCRVVAGPRSFWFNLQHAGATLSNCQHQARFEHTPTGAGDGTSLPESRMTCCFCTIKVDLKQRKP